MSTLLFTLDELLGFLSEHGMVPIGRSIEGRADLDHRIIRDEDLPTTE
jgi:hypothetical protein